MPARILTAVIVLLAAIWTAWPYGRLWFFGQAVDAGDTGRIERAVDWESVRDHLKGDVKRRLSEEIGKDGETDDPGEAVARSALILLGSAIAEELINAYATPESLITVLREIADAGEGEGDFIDAVSYAFFAAPTSFRVHVRPPGSQDEGKPLALTFTFQDFDWVLTRIQLPFDELEGGEPERKRPEPKRGPEDQKR